MARTVRSASDDTGISVHLEHESLHLVFLHQFFLPLFRIHIHAAEFVYLKALSVLPHADLGEEYGTRRSDVDRRHQKDREDPGDQKSHHSSHIDTGIDKAFRDKFLLPGSEKDGVHPPCLYVIGDICHIAHNRNVSHLFSLFCVTVGKYDPDDFKFIKTVYPHSLECVLCFFSRCHKKQFYLFIKQPLTSEKIAFPQDPLCIYEYYCRRDKPEKRKP